MENKIVAIELKTVKDWNACRDAIGQFSPVTLRIDDDVITISLGFVSKTKLEYAIYINGAMKAGETQINKEKYWLTREKNTYSPKYIKSLEKKFGKRVCKDIIPEERRKIRYYSPVSASFLTIKNQYIKRHPVIFWIRS